MSDPRISVAHGTPTVSAERVIDALDAVRPVIYIGSAISGPAATATAALISMLGRLFPHLTVDGEARLGPNPWGASSVGDVYAILARTRPVPSRLPARDVSIGISRGTDAWLSLGGDDWTACIGPGELSIGTASHGVGLHAAATLIVAELAKLALGPVGMPCHPLNGQLVWNLIDYTNSIPPSVDSAPAIHLNVGLLGAGSVGSSAAGVLTCVPAAAGTIDVVDGDTFDPTKNPFRYPASTGNEHGPKVQWLKSMLDKAGWQTRPFFGSVADWVASRPNPGYDGTVVSSVDGLDGRFQVADVLARTTLSVGVGGLALHLQRETLGNGLACPYCEYVDATPPLGQVPLWAQMTGLSVERVTALVANDEPLSTADVDAAVRQGRLARASSESLIGRRLVDLVGRVYAQASVPAGSGERIRVSAPYVSWMGGVLAAAELLKEAIGLPLIDRRVDLDLSGLPSGFTRRIKADESGRCACASPIRKRWMRRLYGT